MENSLLFIFRLTATLAELIPNWLSHLNHQVYGTCPKN